MILQSRIQKNQLDLEIQEFKNYLEQYTSRLVTFSDRIKYSPYFLDKIWIILDVFSYNKYISILAIWGIIFLV